MARFCASGAVFYRPSARGGVEAKALIDAEGLTWGAWWKSWHHERREVRQQTAPPTVNEIHDWLKITESKCCLRALSVW